MDKLTLAFEFAKAAHRSINQKRKYSGEDYIIHPIRVVNLLESVGESDQEVLQAAYLHDVLEDVAPVNPVYRAERIKEEFGPRVLELVQELTDEYTSEKYPAINRAARKKQEAVRLSNISVGAMKIKLADLIDNTSDITKNDPGFARVYLEEKRRIIELMGPVVERSTDSVLKSLYKFASIQVTRGMI